MNSFRSFVANFTAALILFQSSLPAFAHHPPYPDDVAFTVRVTNRIPLEGWIDSRVGVSNTKDPQTLALHTLRATVVQDLLETRKGLKALLGGTTRLTALHRSERVKSKSPDDRTFEVPSEITDLFGSETLGKKGVLEPTDSSVAKAIDWLHSSASETESTFDADTRRKLSLGLAVTSIAIVRLDTLIRFLDIDYFKDSNVAEALSREVVSPAFEARNGPGQRTENTDFAGFSKRSIGHWRARIGYERLVMTLRVQRENLLDRYHLLAYADTRTRWLIKPTRAEAPLYQRIYDVLEEKFGFPDASLALKPVSAKLPKDIEELTLPDTFDRLLFARLDAIRKSPGVDAFAQQLLVPLNDSIDSALIGALRANTERLRSLGKAGSAVVKAKTEWGRLASMDEVWSSAAAQFDYLDPQIQFEKQKQAIQTELQRQDKNAKIIKYSVYAGAVGLGVVGIVGSLGTAAPVLGLGARWWFVSSGVGVTGRSVVDYSDAHAQYRFLETLYTGSAKSGTHASTAAAYQLTAEQFAFLASSVVVLMCDAAIFTMLSKASVIRPPGAKAPRVSLTPGALTATRNAIAKAVERVEYFVPYGRGFIFSLKRLARMNAAPRAQRLMSLDDALTQGALELNTSKSSLLTKLKAHPVMNNLVTRYRNRIQADPTLFATMRREMIVSAVADLVGEVTARGDHFADELDEVGKNLVMSVILGAAITLNASPVRAAVQAKPTLFAHLNDRTFVRSLPEDALTDGFSALRRGAVSNFKFGLSAMAIASGGTELLAWAHDPSEYNAREGLESMFWNTLYSGTFIGVSSSFRFGAMQSINSRITEALDGNPKLMIRLRGLGSSGGRTLTVDPASALPWGVSFINNAFGAWHFTKIARWIGIQGEPKLQDDLQSAYIRVDEADHPSESDASSAYLFDFLE